MPDYRATLIFDTETRVIEGNFSDTPEKGQPMKDTEYCIVSDKTSEVLLSTTDIRALSESVALLTKAQAEFTIFKEIGAKTIHQLAASQPEKTHAS